MHGVRVSGSFTIPVGSEAKKELRCRGTFVTGGGVTSLLLLL